MNTSIVDLPFNRFIGLQVAEEPHLLKLPPHDCYLNHLGTVHASAMLALAEASSGAFLLRHLGSRQDLVPVVRRLESKFRKPAHGTITAISTTPVADLETLERQWTSKGRALVSITIELHDEAGEQVMSAVVDWFIAKA